jgi:hypothetical protein
VTKASGANRIKIKEVISANRELWSCISIMSVHSSTAPINWGAALPGCSHKITREVRYAELSQVGRTRPSAQDPAAFLSAVVEAGCMGVGTHETSTCCSDWRDWLSWIAPL